VANRIAGIRVISFLLLAAGGALCQSEHHSVDLFHGLQLEESNSSEVWHQGTSTWRSLPDAPSTVQPPKQQGDEASLPLTVGTVGMNGLVVRETGAGLFLSKAPSVSMLYKEVPDKKGIDAFFSKYADASRQQNSRYQQSSSYKLMGRATDAASRMFVIRGENGTRKLNTAYFLRVLTSVAAQNASRHYRARSGAAPLSDFGSTLGRDAGMNLLHEFGPGIRQIVKGHAPTFVFRIGEPIANHETPSEVVSISTR
jgi:hypothetical protein